MIWFVFRRLTTMVVTMFIVSIVVFLLAEAAPGNVARNILGVFASPEQEASFRAQLGLNQPLYVRYLSWLLGSDWRASRVLGMPLTTVTTDEGYEEWWAVEEDGTLVRWRYEDRNLYAVRRAPDGTVTETLDNGRWRPGEDPNTQVAWVVDRQNRVTKMAKGEGVTVWMRSKNGWIEKAGGGIEYIPLKKGILRGDPGVSIKTGRAIAPTLARRFINSAILAGTVFVTVMPLALFLGVIAGVYSGRFIDRLLSIGGLVFTATPQFATGVFLILIFATWLKVLPGATVFDRPDAILARPEMLVLPILTLALIELGYILRITRASMIEVMNTGYIRTAILKGLPYRKVILRHALRNALLAPVTVIMLHVNWLIGGIVVVEAIFGYPGLGKYLYDSALYKDVFAMQSAAMIMVALAVGTQLIADIVYTVLNPRVRYT